MSNCCLESLNSLRRATLIEVKQILNWQLTFTLVFETRLLNCEYFFGSFSFIQRNLSVVLNSGKSLHCIFEGFRSSEK